MHLAAGSEAIGRLLDPVGLGLFVVLATMDAEPAEGCPFAFGRALEDELRALTTENGPLRDPQVIGFALDFLDRIEAEDGVPEITEQLAQRNRLGPAGAAHHVARGHQPVR